MSKSLKDYKFFTLVLLLGATAIAFALMFPFREVILLAIIWAVLFYPSAQWFKDKLKVNDNIAAIVSILFSVFIVALPIFFFFLLVFQNIIDFTSIIPERLNGGSLTQVENLIDTINNALISVPFFESIQLDSSSLQFVYNGLLNTIGSNLTFISIGAGRLLIETVIGIIVFILFVSFFITNGKQILAYFRDMKLVANSTFDKLIDQSNLTVKVMIKSLFITGGVQAVLAMFAFLYYEIPYTFLWTGITFISSVLPIGSGVVLFPTAAYFIITGRILDGIILFLYAAFVVGLADNYLRSKIGSSELPVATPFLFVGIIGGLLIFRFPGIVIGPAILVLWKVLLDIYKEERLSTKRLSSATE